MAAGKVKVVVYHLACVLCSHSLSKALSRVVRLVLCRSSAIPLPANGTVCQTLGTFVLQAPVCLLQARCVVVACIVDRVLLLLLEQPPRE
jgi:hypothetical protein